MSTVRSSSRQESMTLPPPQDAGLLLIALAGISASGPLMAATAAPALAIAFWRNAFGAGFTAALTVVRSRREWAQVGRRGWLLAVLAGIFLALHFGTWVPSVKFTSVASATGLVATQSIFTGLIAAASGRRLPRAAWFGIALAFLGTLFIAGADLHVSVRAVTGDGLATLGGLFAASYVTVGGHARRVLSTAIYTIICYSVCALALLVACLAGGQPLGGYPARAWLYLALVTVAAQLLGHSLINVVLRSASATFVSLAVLLEVPGAAIIAYFWLHQHPPVWAYPGLGLLAVGLVMVVRAGARAADID
ncbi:MAG TPA: DMT family transporter [Jatrophihabitans sp.]|nr:DMT family transporter [Jatrophihabitans sp.]